MINKIDKERIEKLEIENEIIKKILVYFVTRVDAKGQINNFTVNDSKQLEEWLRQLIL